MIIEFAVLKKGAPWLFTVKERSLLWFVYTKASEGDKSYDNSDWVGLIRAVK